MQTEPVNLVRRGTEQPYTCSLVVLWVNPATFLIYELLFMIYDYV
jgi:hypothetical protein